MAKGSWRKVQTGIEDNLKGYLDRTKLIDGYLDRVVYRQYQNRQNQRWMTENVSEKGPQWKALVPTYRAYKLHKYSSFPGSGEKLMIATGTLRKDVVGGGKGHQKLVSDHKLKISWNTPYAIYTEDKRPVNQDWDPAQDKQMYDALAEYLMKGVIKQILGGGY